MAIGALLILSGLFHLAVFFLVGGSWEGPVSWRKPVTFGISFGLTAATLGWLAGYLRQSRLLVAAVRTIAFTCAIEVIWVSMQQWRGVPSHFNEATAFDGALFALMGLVIALTGAGIVFMTLMSWRDIPTSSSMKLAVRAGLALLLAGQFLGFAIIANGNALNVPPQTTNLAIFGAAGRMKVPHGLAMHAIQILPILALLLTLTRLPEGRRFRIVAVAAAGYAGLVGVAAIQSFGGRAPLDLTALAELLVLVSVLLLLAAFARMSRALRAALT